MRLRLTSRMRAGYAAMSVLLLLGGVLTALYTYRIQSATAQLLADNVLSLKAVEAVEAASEKLGSVAGDGLLNARSPELAVLESHQTAFRTALRDVESTARAPQQADIVQVLKTRFVDYEREVSEAVELAARGERGVAVTGLRRAQAVARELYDLSEKLEVVNEEVATAGLGHIEHSNRAMRLAMYGLGASGILLGYVLSLAISRSILNPIYELVVKVRSAAGTELVERVDVPKGAELEELDEHVRHLIDRINATRADLEHSRRLLLRSERLAALGRVSAGVAHEIRNPLTSIKMLIYSMGEDPSLQNDQRKDLAVIATEIDRMDRFVDNFLKFARPSDPQLAPVDMNQIVRETLELLSPRLQQSNIRPVEIHASELRTIAADADQLRQVLMNLVLNALGAMPAGGSLTVETRFRPPEAGQTSGWVQVLVKDTGPGIADELLDTLFDPFVSGRQEGLGLGLAISHQIIRQHGGWIDAANDPAGGAILTVSLPDRRGQDHAQGPGGGRRGERPLLVPQDPA